MNCILDYTKEFSSLERPQIKNTDLEKETLSFYIIDVDSYLPNPEDDNEIIFRLFGLTENNNSFMINVIGFKQYFYLKCPKNVNLSNAFLQDYKSHLNLSLSSITQNLNVIDRISFEPNGRSSSVKVNKLDPHLKIHFQKKHFIEDIKNILSKESEFRGIKFSNDIIYSNYDIIKSFLIDTKIRGMSWIILEKESLTIRNNENKMSFCQFEADIQINKLKPLPPPKGEWTKSVSLRILSFDIETETDKDFKKSFPTPEKKSVIQISSILKRHPSDGKIIKKIFTLGSCSSIEGADVHSFESETLMLKSWNQLICQYDPDILTGWNIKGFDFRYILKRAEVLKISNYYLGRSSFNRPHPHQDLKPHGLFGRIMLDMGYLMRRDYKDQFSKGGSLNKYSHLFLKDQKDGVAYSEMYDLQNGDSETRKKLAVYCIKDSMLPLDLMDKLSILAKYIEKARSSFQNLQHLFQDQQFYINNFNKSKTEEDVKLDNSNSKKMDLKYQNIPQTKRYIYRVYVPDNLLFENLELIESSKNEMYFMLYDGKSYIAAYIKDLLFGNIGHILKDGNYIELLDFELIQTKAESEKIINIKDAIIIESFDQNIDIKELNSLKDSISTDNSDRILPESEINLPISTEPSIQNDINLNINLNYREKDEIKINKSLDFLFSKIVSEKKIEEISNDTINYNRSVCGKLIWKGDIKKLKENQRFCEYWTFMISDKQGIFYLIGIFGKMLIEKFYFKLDIGEKYTIKGGIIKKDNSSKKNKRIILNSQNLISISKDLSENANEDPNKKQFKSITEILVMKKDSIVSFAGLLIKINDKIENSLDKERGVFYNFRRAKVIDNQNHTIDIILAQNKKNIKLRLMEWVYIEKAVIIEIKNMKCIFLGSDSILEFENRYYVSNKDKA